ncbi:MAG: serine/threonine-protein kinase [Planctomycetota bacterium]|nr:serine/threonine-protein kinase [Planctomycetota bacterium]
MNINDAQAHIFRAWNVVPEMMIKIAIRESSKHPGSDLCGILLAYNHLDPARAASVRQAAQQALQQVLAQQAAQQAPAPQKALDESWNDNDLLSTMKMPGRQVKAPQQASPPPFSSREAATRKYGPPMQPPQARPSPQMPPPAMNPPPRNPLPPPINNPQRASSGRQRAQGSERLKLTKPSPYAKLLQRQFEKFVVLEGIAAGGCGAVLKAIHKTSGKTVALKLLLDLAKDGEDFEKICQRFYREAKTLSALNHNNIVRGLDYGVEEGDPYLAMELIEGTNLKVIAEQESNRKSPGYLEWALNIHKIIAGALIHCHERGIIHRDVKPSNIVIEGSTRRPVLVDFGLVKGDKNKFEGNWYKTLSVSGEVVGTPAFMAPEQIDAKGTYGEIGAKTDVWGLAATLFFVLTGMTPYKEKTAMSMFVALLSRAPMRAKEVNADVPDWIDSLIADTLQQEVDSRPTMVEFAAALER